MPEAHSSAPAVCFLLSLPAVASPVQPGPSLSTSLCQLMRFGLDAPLGPKIFTCLAVSGDSPRSTVVGSSIDVSLQIGKDSERGCLPVGPLLPPADAAAVAKCPYFGFDAGAMAQAWMEVVKKGASGGFLKFFPHLACDGDIAVISLPSEVISQGFVLMLSTVAC
ncbi:hypothetical protein Nepgr_018083 [Nepenthes gracilis]|uniref:Uncharacterized protein n=1 Tax=Nepenthes gracilis TaxID=150966 RepID=A0AAD3XSR8_NEPGR|nr:hypothetical protein Nepgr_018083 [Nepenthes gracilis]